ncbi:MAG: serine/threonine-protein phosphatase [Acidimicrobiia bacterium]|nr:serine/threonine-protein phosphatase [Acidimicrobiia bacterium]
MRAANQAILQLVQREPKWKGTYTTLTLVEFSEGMARVAHVGDTRAYLYRQGRITELTNDHTVAWQWMQRGMDPVEAHSLPNSASLVRVLGFDSELEVEETKMSLRDGDRWLICSDGLYRMLSDRDMRDVLESGDTEECVWGLLEKGLSRGASDNATVVLADISL